MDVQDATPPPQDDNNINLRAAFAAAFSAPAAASPAAVEEKGNVHEDGRVTEREMKAAAATGSGRVGNRKRRGGDRGRRKRRASSLRGKMGDNGDEATAAITTLTSIMVTSMTDQDRMHHQWMMARVIVVPFTLSLDQSGL
jgi:hypothetical protein